jgi:hypothetical protein
MQENVLWDTLALSTQAGKGPHAMALASGMN